MPASDLPHLEEAELKTDVQRGLLCMHFWEVFLEQNYYPKIFRPWPLRRVVFSNLNGPSVKDSCFYTLYVSILLALFSFHDFEH